MTHVTVYASGTEIKFDFPSQAESAQEEGRIMDAIMAAILAVRPDLDITGIEFT